MIYVLLKIAVWVLVIGIGYFVFGPQGINSSDGGNTLQNASTQLFLPPAKSERLKGYERSLAAGELQPAEYGEYQALSKAHQSSFWKGSELSVEQALSGVKNHRSEHLASILQKRGLSMEELSIFFTVLKRDHPELLADHE